MKRILSVILALAMMITVISTVLAAQIGQAAQAVSRLQSRTALREVR